MDEAVVLIGLLIRTNVWRLSSETTVPTTIAQPGLTCTTDQLQDGV